MKRLLILSIVMLFNFVVFSQQVDGRLEEHFSQEELSDLMENDPNEFRLINYALDHGLYLTDHVSGKADIPTIDVSTSNLPTYLELGLELQDVNQYFKVNGEEKMLVLKSRWVLNNELTKETK